MPDHLNTKHRWLTTDKQLFVAISEGDERAFRLIFDRYRQKTWSFVLTLVKSQHIAEEIIQESFIKLWENRKALAEVKNPDDYLFIFVRNHLFNTLRNMTREEKKKAQLKKNLEQREVYMDHYWLEVQQAAQMLEQIIARLPNQQKKIILLKREKALSLQEIADKLKISKNTVKKHLSVALKTCRKQLVRMGVQY